MKRFHLFLILVASTATLSLAGCGGGGTSSGGGGGGTTQVAEPSITTKAAENGAEIVSIADTASSATIYYTTDGTTPTTSSQIFEAPFLVTASATVKAMAVASGDTNSNVASESLTISIPSGTLVWSDEFNNTSGANEAPSASTWTYDTGAGGWGNSELETYCAANSNTAPCSTSSPNAFVDTNGYLNIAAEEPSAGTYTSARMKTEGLFSFQYGRIEVRAKVPEEQGFWPAFWMLGNNITTVSWPDCGEMDVLERVDAAGTPDWNTGSVHGPNFYGTAIGTNYYFPTGVTASDWHTYGAIWKKGSVSYYVDDPTNPYVTYTPASLSGYSGASWPFDNGQSNFIILNMAVGGSWPGSPNSSTTFPAALQFDYVRIYTN